MHALCKVRPVIEMLNVTYTRKNQLATMGFLAAALTGRFDQGAAAGFSSPAIYLCNIVAKCT